MIEIKNFQIVRKGSLIARFDAKIMKWGGVIIKDCGYFESNDKKWINLPSRSYEVEGKKKYAPYIFYEDRDLNDKFKETIMKAAEEMLMKSLDIPQEKQEEIPF